MTLRVKSLGLKDTPLLLVVDVVAADCVFTGIRPVEERLALELIVPPNSIASAVTTPALVNTRPEIATKGLGLATKV